VRAVRKKQGLTQLDVVALAGKSNRFLIDLERGKETPQLQMVLDVLALLDIEFALKEKTLRRKRQWQSPCPTRYGCSYLTDSPVRCITRPRCHLPMPTPGLLPPARYHSIPACQWHRARQMPRLLRRFSRTFSPKGDQRSSAGRDTMDY
jgi:HTH-type transcriptional regulator/antitoxin HipB